MNVDQINYSETRDIEREAIIALYWAYGWSAADKPQQLFDGLMNSYSLISAWDSGRLWGLGNAISDGHLVVYYPHLLVLPEYHGKGIGSNIMRILMSKYENFHQQMLIVDAKAIEFYKKCGFVRAGKTEPMWIFQGREH